MSRMPAALCLNHRDTPEAQGKVALPAGISGVRLRQPVGYGQRGLEGVERRRQVALSTKHVADLDVSEFAAQQRLDAPVGWSDIRVAYHAACSLQHGQKITSEPRELLRNAGFTVLEIPEGHICCGSAGTYNILQPELAKELKERKLQAIDSVKPDCVATGNIGCMNQL